MRNRYLVSIVMAVLAIVLAGCSRNPDVAKRKYLESGMKYMEQEKYDSAAIQFKKALQIDPKYAEAHYQLANADMKQGKNPDAFQRDDLGGRAGSRLISRLASPWAACTWHPVRTFTATRKSRRATLTNTIPITPRAMSFWAMFCWARSTWTTPSPRSAKPSL